VVEPGYNLASIKLTAWSSSVLSVCLAIAFNRSTINLFIALDLINTRRIGFKIFTIVIYMLLPKHSSKLRLCIYPAVTKVFWNLCCIATVNIGPCSRKKQNAPTFRLYLCTINKLSPATIFCFDSV